MTRSQFRSRQIHYHVGPTNSGKTQHAIEILKNLELGEFKCKLNHRLLLDSIMDLCGVPAEKFRPICSAIDKLDKEPWSEVRREMVEDKGLPEASADKIGTFVCRGSMGAGKRVDPREMHKILSDEGVFATHPGAMAAMEELDKLWGYLDAMGSLQYVSFDLSLARGLDYYTGLIYECVHTQDGGPGVGSIAAGGRYDKLVGMFSGTGAQVPCVGVSIGVERIFAIMEANAAGKGAEPNVQCFVASVGKGMLGYPPVDHPMVTGLEEAVMRGLSQSEGTSDSQTELKAAWNAWARAAWAPSRAR